MPTTADVLAIPTSQGSERKLWTPEQISPLSWWDATDASTITSVDGKVSVWTDKGSANDPMRQSTEANKPITGSRTLNGLNVFDCSGSQHVRASDYPMPSSGDIAIFLVAVVDAVASTSEAVLSMDNGSNDWQLEADNATQFDGELVCADIGSTVALTGGPFPGPSIYNTNFDFSGAGVYNVFVDGTQRAVDTTYSAKISTVSNTFRIFSNRGGSITPDGAFGECIAVTDLTTATRQLIEGYLAWRWGITLPSGHPYEDGAPTI